MDTNRLAVDALGVYFMKWLKGEGYEKILLFVYPTFAEFEITVATALLKNKYEIITASLTKELIISETGLQVQPHIELSEVRVEEYEGLLFPAETRYI